MNGLEQRGAPREGIGYFARFGVTERLIAEALAAALSRGGDSADVFFQHRVATDLGLEDGAVNRAYASVELGVGVRVVKGDQTGYGYTEDLSLPAAPRVRPDRRRHRRRARRAPGPTRLPRRRRPARTATRSSGPGRRCGRTRSCRSLAGLNAAGLRRRPARPEGERPPARRGGRDPRRRLDGPARRGRAADDAALALAARPSRTAGASRTATTSPAAPASSSTRPSGSTGVVREAVARTDHPLRGRAAAGRRDAGGARRRLLRHPAPRGHRPRHGGRLQPQGHLHLRRQDRQAHRRSRS